MDIPWAPQVQRGLWFELFNEYTLIAVGGGFVSLPLEEFTRLSPYAATRNGNFAPPRVAFAMMSLLGAGDAKAKADVIFEMHQTEGKLTPDGARPLVEALVHALRALDLTKKQEVGDALASTPISPRFDVDDVLTTFFDEEMTPLSEASRRPGRSTNVIVLSLGRIAAKPRGAT